MGSFAANILKLNELGESMSLSTPSPAWEQEPANHWDVSVSRDGENILTISHNMLAGKADLDACDQATIRHAGEHLLSFIGARAADASQIAELEARLSVSEQARMLFKRDAEETRDQVVALSAQVGRQNAEIDVLRGVHCLVDGDGPCGVCVKCLRLRAEAAESQVAQLTQEKDELRARMAKWPDTWRRAAALSGKAGTPAYIDAAHAYEVCADDIDGELAQLRQQGAEKEKA